MPNDEEHRIVLTDGRSGHVVRRHDGWMLEIGGVQDSHLPDPGHPLALAYARWMLAALGADDRQRFAHLGGGLLMVPRAIAQRWPQTEQVVVESEPVLISLVRTRFTPPRGITLLEGDARRWLAQSPSGSQHAILVDVFQAGRIPPAFSSIEFAREAARVLTDDGLLVINSVAGPQLDFTRRQLAGLQSVFPRVAMIVQGSSLGGLRFGNACLIASGRDLRADSIRAALRGDPSKGALVTDLSDIVGDATPLSEDDGVWSPEPSLPDTSGALAMTEHIQRVLKGLLPKTSPDD